MSLLVSPVLLLCVSLSTSSPSPSNFIVRGFSLLLLLVNPARSRIGVPCLALFSSLSSFSFSISFDRGLKSFCFFLEPLPLVLLPTPPAVADKTTSSRSTSSSFELVFLLLLSLSSDKILNRTTFFIVAAAADDDTTTAAAAAEFRVCLCSELRDCNEVLETPPPPIVLLLLFNAIMPTAILLLLLFVSYETFITSSSPEAPPPPTPT